MLSSLAPPPVPAARRPSGKVTVAPLLPPLLPPSTIASSASVLRNEARNGDGVAGCAVAAVTAETAGGGVGAAGRSARLTGTARSSIPIPTAASASRAARREAAVEDETPTDWGTPVVPGRTGAWSGEEEGASGREGTPDGEDEEGEEPVARRASEVRSVGEATEADEENAPEASGLGEAEAEAALAGGVVIVGGRNSDAGRPALLMTVPLGGDESGKAIEVEGAGGEEGKPEEGLPALEGRASDAPVRHPAGADEEVAAARGDGAASWEAVGGGDAAGGGGGVAAGGGGATGGRGERGELKEDDISARAEGCVDGVAPSPPAQAAGGAVGGGGVEEEEGAAESEVTGDGTGDGGT